MPSAPNELLFPAAETSTSFLFVRKAAHASRVQHEPGLFGSTDTGQLYPGRCPGDDPVSFSVSGVRIANGLAPRPLAYRPNLVALADRHSHHIRAIPGERIAGARSFPPAM